MLRLSIGSCMLRLRLSFRGSDGQLSLSLGMHEPMLSLSMLVVDPNHLD